MNVISVPLDMVSLCVCGFRSWGFLSFLGIDLAGGQVFPPPEVVGVPISAADSVSLPLDVCSTCTVTWAQVHKVEGVVDLEGLYFSTADGSHAVEMPKGSESMVKSDDSAMLPADIHVCLNRKVSNCFLKDSTESAKHS